MRVSTEKLFSWSLARQGGVLSGLFMAYHFKDCYRVVAFLQESRLLLSSMYNCAYPIK